jgi:hypothetical protein
LAIVLSLKDDYQWPYYSSPRMNFEFISAKFYDKIRLILGQPVHY